SCHSIGALRDATRSPWVEVHLVRVNPIGSHMDAAREGAPAEPQTVLSLMHEMRAAGKGIIGMKILGQGDMPIIPFPAARISCIRERTVCGSAGAPSRAASMCDPMGLTRTRCTSTQGERVASRNAPIEWQE